MTRHLRTLILGVPLLASHAAGSQQTEFAALVSRLSEDGGFFQSDNLVSNETSYLHALDELRVRGLKGGAYLGVGPEQGFSYIAELQPAVAIMIDIRRDNLLLHLLFKAMFETARNRLEYLGMLYGRPVPGDLPMWTDVELGQLIDYLDRTQVDRGLHARTHQDLMRRVELFGIPLTPEDRETVRRFHDEFAYSGLDIRYSSRGRFPRMSFPTIRQLYLETDLAGNLGSYLATENRWRRVRELQRRDGVVPVVGDLSGPKAVKAIAAYLREIHQPVSAFYLSNVESYLFRYGTFAGFVDNVRALPAAPGAVLIRSWFGRGIALPNSLPGHYSTQLVQPVTRFLELTQNLDRVTYWSLVNDTPVASAPRISPRLR